MGIKVAKFGGTSLADASQFKKVKAIIDLDSDRKFIVNSAPGKRSGDDIKVTDMLYACKKCADQEELFNESIEDVFNRFNQIIEELELTLDLRPYLDQIKADIKAGATDDYTASRGEYLNGIIMAEYLGIEFVDPSTIIVFDGKKFNPEKTQALASERLKGCEAAVVPGFYGADENQQIVTFSRGGSDITGAIVAKAVGADIYENWTDVSGMLAADPRIVTNPNPIAAISYAELRELASMGASVLHEDAVAPVKDAGIPINIRNTNKPEDPGTLVGVKNEDASDQKTPTGVSGKKGFSMMNIDFSGDMSGTYLQNLMEQLANLGLTDKYILKGVDKISLVLQNEVSPEKEEEIKASMMKNGLAEAVTIIPGIALVAIVGEGFEQDKMLAKVAMGLSEAELRMILSLTYSAQSMFIGVEEEKLADAIRSIYQACYS